MAATTEVGRLSVNLTAETAAFTQDLNKARVILQRSTAEMQSNLGRVGAGFQSAATMAKGFIATLGVAGVVSFGKRILDTVGSLTEMGEQAGVSASQLYALQLAGLQAGVSTEQLQGSLEKLTRKIGEAADGGDEAVKTFRGLGVGVLDASGKVRPTVEVMGDVAERVKMASSEAEQARIAFEAFGKAGQKLIPILKGGRAGLEDMFGGVAGRDIDRISKEFDELGDKIARAAKEKTLAIAAYVQQARDLVGDRSLAILAGAGGGAIAGGFVAGPPGALIGAAAGAGIAAYVTAMDEAERATAQLREQVDRLTKAIENIGDSAQPIMQKMKADFTAQRIEVQKQLDFNTRMNELATKSDGSPFVGGPGATSNPRTRTEINESLQRTIAVQAFVDALRLERDSLGLTEAASLRLRMERERDVKVVDGQIVSTQRFTQAQIGEAVALKSSTEEWARQIDVRQRIAAVMVEVAAQQDEMNAESQKIETARNRLVNLSGPKEIEQLQAQAAALRAAVPEWDALTGEYRANTRELDVLRRSQELLNQNLGLSQEEVRKLAEGYVDATEEMRKATAATDRTTQRMNAGFDELANFGDRAFDRIGASITDAFAKGEDAMVSFRSIARAIFSELSQEGLKLFALNPAKNSLFGQNNATGGDLISKLLGNTFGGGGGGLSPGLDAGGNPLAASGGGGFDFMKIFSGIGSMFGGFFADGGRPPVGKASIVGENGPEWFVPSGAGRIVPNGGMGGATVVHMTVIPRDVDGFRAAQRQIATSLGRQLDMRAKNQ